MYQIRKLTEERAKSRYIILTQMKNLHETQYSIDPILLIGTANYSWHRWQRWFYRVNSKRQLPIHYMIEQVLDDYVIYVAAPEHVPSYFVKDLVNAKLIPDRYRESIVIGVAEDFTLERMDTRLYEQLVHRLIVPLMKRYKIKKNEVVYIDDILDWTQLINKMQVENLTYNIQKEYYFDRVAINRYLSKHLPSITKK